LSALRHWAEFASALDRKRFGLRLRPGSKEEEIMEIHWYLIPHDGPYPWNPKGQRLIDFAYLRQIATTVDHLGYDGALLAGGGGAHDLWGLGFSLIPYTERMKFIIAQHPGTLSPMLLAQQAATFDQFSQGRLIINIVNGADGHGLPYGVFLDHDERYAMADEYWGVWRRIMSGETVDFDGRYVKLRNARLGLKPLQQPYPELYFGGSSPSAQQVAAKHTDTYLSHLGRTAATGAGKGRFGAAPGVGPGTPGPFWHSDLPDRARNQGGGMGCGAVALRSHGQGGDRAQPRYHQEYRLRWTTAHERHYRR
jgi:hypothetical protein